MTSECRSDPGEFAPVIDRGKCEGKADCVEVCPFHVFEVRRIDEADFAQLGVFGKLKSMAHGRKLVALSLFVAWGRRSRAPIPPRA